MWGGRSDLVAGMEPDAVSSLLDRLRWTVARYSRDELGADGDQGFRGAEVRFHHVVSGDARIAVA